MVFVGEDPAWHTGAHGFQGPPDGDTIQPVKQILFWLILAAMLVTVITLYHSRRSRLDVTPDAQHEIDRAKRR